MKTKKQIIKIEKSVIDEYNDYLDSGDAYPNAGRYETVESWTADFDDGIEAGIKVCSTGDCDLFVDAVLFRDGCECALFGDPEYELDGEYEFEYNGETYVVEVVAA